MGDSGPLQFVEWQSLAAHPGRILLNDYVGERAPPTHTCPLGAERTHRKKRKKKADPGASACFFPMPLPSLIQV